MKGRGNRDRGDRKVHAIDPDRYDQSPYRRTMCRKSISRRYTTADSGDRPVNCPDCIEAVGRAIEASCCDSTCVGELFDWSALLLPGGRRS